MTGVRILFFVDPTTAWFRVTTSINRKIKIHNLNLIIQLSHDYCHLEVAISTTGMRSTAALSTSLLTTSPRAGTSEPINTY